MMRPTYLEPRTDSAAAEDWSTALILTEERSMMRTAVVLALVCFVLTISAVGMGNGGPGSVGAVVLLALLTLCCALALWGAWPQGRHYRRLLGTSWRRCSATAVVDDPDVLDDRLAVFDGRGTLLVRGMLSEISDVVLHHQEVFLCGPDEQGRVAIRVAGLCRLYQGRVAEGEWRPRERDPVLGPRPLDDPAVRRAFRGFRSGQRVWLVPTMTGAVGVTELVLSLFPVTPVGFVVGGLLLAAAIVLAPWTVMLSRWHREAVGELVSATAWTLVPVTLFPWEPNQEVTGLAQLPEGPALVQFPEAGLDIIANIADTGTMWIAGEPREVIAVGLPRTPVLTFALLDRSRNEPDEPRNTPVLTKTLLRGIPALRR